MGPGPWILAVTNTGGVYVDGTFGRGGHTRAMLAALSPAGRLHAFDMDPEAIKVGKELMAADSRFTILGCGHSLPFTFLSLPSPSKSRVAHSASSPRKSFRG